ncbi:MAG: tetratricopeptide repeat protein [Bryobacteraceae bacterium]
MRLATGIRHCKGARGVTVWFVIRVLVGFLLLASAAVCQTRSSAFESNHKMAEMYASKGKLPEAIPYFEKAYAADPAHYVNGYDLALAYIETGALNKGRKTLDAMLGRGDRAELHNLRGLLEERAGAVQPALAEYQRAAQMEPSEKNLFDLGNVLVRAKGAEQAIEVLGYGSGKYPQSARLRVALGVAYYAHSEYDKAVAALCEGVDLDPTDSRAIYFLGKMFDISPALSGEVRKRLARLVQAYPKNAAANYYYAVSLWNRDAGDARRDGEIERYLKQALALDPKMAEAHFQLGVLYQDQQKLPLAVREFELAVKAAPENEKFHYRLAQAYKSAGNEQASARELARYRQLRPKQ